jgi:HEAT repeat protein
MGLGNDLLKEIFHGYPVEKISALLRSDRESAVKAGVWIASELTDAARPLLDDLRPLLDSPSAYIKCYAVEAIEMAATGKDGEILSRAIALIDDDDERVRRRAFGLLAQADREQLVGAVSHVADEHLKTTVQRLLDDEVLPASGSEILDRLSMPDRTDSLFALATAVRTRQHESQAGCGLHTRSFAYILGTSQVTVYSGPCLVGLLGC